MTSPIMYMSPRRILVMIPICLVTLLLLIASVSAAGEGAGAVAKVNTLAGQARITRAATGIQIAAATGLDMFLKDGIQTMEKSRLSMKFVDGSVVQVGSRSKLVISSYMYDPKRKVRNTGLGLLAGAIKFTTAKLMGFKEKKFQITTPTATCGARGTSVEIHYDPVSDETVILNVSQDGSQVFVQLKSDPSKVVILEPGQAIVATTTGFRQAAPPDLKGLKLQLMLKLTSLWQQGRLQKFVHGAFGPGSRIPSAGGDITPDTIFGITSTWFRAWVSMGWIPLPLAGSARTGRR